MQTLGQYDFGVWVDAAVGTQAEAVCKRDVLEHIRALEQALESGREDQYVEYLRWAAVVLESFGVDKNELAVTLRALLEVLQSELEGELRARVASFLKAGLDRLQRRPLVEVEVGEAPFNASVPGGKSYSDPGLALKALRKPLARAAMALHFMKRPEDALRFNRDFDARARSLRDIEYHLSFLEEALNAGNPSLFLDYVKWADGVLQAAGVPRSALIQSLVCLQDTLGFHLSSTAASGASDFIQAGLAALAVETVLPPTFLDAESPLADVASSYLAALQAGDRRQASKIVLDAAIGGVAVSDIYLEVLQPAQYEIGRLWQLGEMSVAEEHFCSAVTQSTMSQLCAYLEPAQLTRSVVVATAIGDHEIGLRMLCDLLEEDGWTSYYLGGNTPIDSVLKAVVDRKATLLAISVAMTFNLDGLSELIQRARAHCPGVKIVVGGYPFKVDSDLWRSVGADGSAADARTAVEVVRTLVSSDK